MKDFKLLRDCPYIFLVDPVLQAMMEKWSNVYKEEKLAESWYKEWGYLAFSRITLNENNPFLSGFPCDNNTVESTNGKDKQYFDLKRFDGVTFVNLLAQRVSNHSMCDTEFYTKLNRKVHNKELYLCVYETCNDLLKKVPCFMNVTIPYTNEKLGIPTGSFLIPTQNCFDEMHDAISREKHLKEAPPTTSKEYIDWLKCEGWVKNYKSVLHSTNKKLPSTLLQPYSCRYECMKHWLSTFHLIQCYWVYEEDENKEVKHLLQVLEQCGLGPITYKELLEKESGSLVLCNCGTFLHYGWCVHACAFAYEYQIITKYPAFMDPTSIMLKRKVGAPTKNTGSRALTKK